MCALMSFLFCPSDLLPSPGPVQCTSFYNWGQCSFNVLYGVGQTAALSFLNKDSLLLPEQAARRASSAPTSLGVPCANSPRYR